VAHHVVPGADRLVQRGCGPLGVGQPLGRRLIVRQPLSIGGSGAGFRQSFVCATLTDVRPPLVFGPLEPIVIGHSHSHFVFFG